VVSFFTFELCLCQGYKNIEQETETRRRFPKRDWQALELSRRVQGQHQERWARAPRDALLRLKNSSTSTPI